MLLNALSLLWSEITLGHSASVSWILSLLQVSIRNGHWKNTSTKQLPGTVKTQNKKHIGMNPILTYSGCGGANLIFPEVQAFEFRFVFFLPVSEGTRNIYLGSDLQWSIWGHQKYFCRDSPPFFLFFFKVIFLFPGFLQLVRYRV